MSLSSWLNEEVGTKRTPQQRRLATPSAPKAPGKWSLYIWHGLSLYMVAAMFLKANAIGIGMIAFFWIIGVKVIKQVAGWWAKGEITL